MLTICIAGKGTSARDGSALAGALLEYLDQHAVTGVFATHLHEIFHLPLQLKSVKEKRMGFVVEDVEVQEVEKNNIRHAKDYGSSNESGVRVRWTYQLEDGRCEDSMALTTARQYHIDRSVIYRAEELLRAFDSYCRPPQAQPELIEQQEEPMENVDTSHVNTDVAKEGLKKGNEEANRDMETISTGKIYNLQSEVAPVVESVFAEVLGDDRKGLVGKGIYIPVNHLVPALLEGSSILYVLHLSSTRSRDGSEVGLLYVGETESLTQRLHQHRVQYRKKGIQVEAMAWRVTDKSTARQIETLCLRKLKAQGFTLDRDSDSRHKLFGGMQL